MELESATGKLNAYFDGRQPEIMGMIERLVNMDSFSEDGEDVNKVGETVSGWMREAGFHTEKIAKPAIDPDESWMEKLGNVFSARTHEREAGPGIVFLGHMDTVFPAGTAAARPFRVEGGRAYGPGVADMKAGVVANMFAARALKDLGLIDVPMTLMFSPDEELGAPTATRVYRERISGARAVICAEPGFPDGGVTTERRGSGHFHMRISGISAHAGRCYEDGASAILELAHKIVALDAFVDAQAQTIVNTGLISGGNSANAVAPWADARIHITFNTVDAAERLVENVRAVAARTFVPRTTTRSAAASGCTRWNTRRTWKHCSAWRNGPAQLWAATPSGATGRSGRPKPDSPPACWASPPFAAWAPKGRNSTPPANTCRWTPCCRAAR